ncbi:hypothetical protein [Streptomyces sp. CAI-85]|uniref:hypothetical protein n=1 Tax=Streptomyces sp. CAI-85 TaxID=1472662 RepID=UPI001587EC04|nr:hypothetical protein [Streptomyces sp. CAI-85]NUV64291.1 hypothetical protein [Streptomyces sp. CAI-85]
MSPLAGAALYAAVTGRANGGCECAHDRPGGCGRLDHPVTGRWCHQSAGPGVPLHVTPVDPATPDHTAVTLGPDELLALCRACYVRRRNTHRKTREQQLAAELAERQGALFALDTEGITP